VVQNVDFFMHFCVMSSLLSNFIKHLFMYICVYHSVPINIEGYMCSMCIPGKVILGSRYHKYNGIAVEHGACAIHMYVHDTYMYGTISIV